MQFLLLTISVCVALKPQLQNDVRDQEEFKLTIIHTNDVHAHFMESDGSGGTCKDGGKCYGGAARRATVIKDIQANHENVLLLDAGDQSQGTPWYNYYKGAAAAHFLRALNYTAFAIGNHEFDNGVDSFVDHFINNVTEEEQFSILACNIDATGEPRMDGKYQCSYVIEVGGVNIGIIGYTTEETPSISDTGNLIFTDVVKAIQQEVQYLRNTKECQIVIGLGHYGYNEDKKMAEQVDLDVIIGGHIHSHSLLWTDGEFDENDASKVVGPYPTFEMNVKSRTVPICQAFEFGKYLGHLDLTFHKNGERYVLNDNRDVVGRTILLSDDIEEDPLILKELQKWEKPVEEIIAGVTGETLVTLDGDRTSCRRHECSMGNFVTDAILKDQHIKAITVGDVLTVFPFEGTFDQLYFKGSTLRKGFEHSVHRYIEAADSNPGEFLQVSGFQVVFDMSSPSGRRVESLMVRCTDCNIPAYQNIEDDKDYCVIMSGFTADGGDGFTMFKDEAINQTIGGVDSAIMNDMVQTMSPIYYGVEGRITIKSAAQNNHYYSIYLVTFSIFLINC